MSQSAMDQWRSMKAAHPDKIVFFRMGDFYELFDDDAVVASRVLNIALTSRDKTLPMAGFPHHAVETHLRKLLQAGHRVAVVDQLADPSAVKGVVPRGVTRVVTPGTVTEDELLDPRRPNHLAALVPSKHGVGLAWVELTAGAFHAADVPADRLADELARLAPAECVCAEFDLDRLAPRVGGALPRPLTPRPDWTFDAETAAAALHAHFGVRTLSGFGFDDCQPCLVAAGSLLLYLKETVGKNLAHLGRIRRHAPERVLLLDEVTRRSLELTRTLRDGGRDGSLLSVIDRTETAMGARLLHDWLVAPLTDKAAIDARLDAVGELVEGHQFRTDLRGRLGSASDLQRLSARVSTLRATPKDVACVGRTLAVLPAVKALLAGRRSALLRELEAKLDLLPDVRESIESALAADPPADPKEGDVNRPVIRPGYHGELDGYRDAASNGKKWIAQYQAREITRTGIPSLKVGYNTVFGYYIEVTHAHLDAVQKYVEAKEYFRKQTLTKAERYITTELKEYEDKILSAGDHIQRLEVELFTALRERVAAQAGRVLAVADVLATLDVLAGLAELAAARHYCRPEVTDAPVLELRDARHPVLDQTLPAGTFVPNDVTLSPDAGWFWLVTGPNMAGKSTFLRQTALLTLLAHMGSFVPAARAVVGLTDRVFTRVGASDELSRGQSTFMVEMTEAANILNNATGRSLVILDEIGRGTSTYDGVSLAWAITEYLHNAVGCRALFATHYHELAQLADALPGLRNSNVQVRETDGDVVFLHKIGPGAAGKSYGIHVARLAGVPGAVLSRARAVLAGLEATHQLPPPPPPAAVPTPAGGTPAVKRPRRRAGAGPTLFGYDDPPEGPMAGAG